MAQLPCGPLESWGVAVRDAQRVFSIQGPEPTWLAGKGGGHGPWLLKVEAIANRNKEKRKERLRSNRVC